MPLNQFSRIKWERARDLRKRGEYQEAEKVLKEALDEEPEHLLLRSSLAELYLRQGRLVEAKVLAEAILSLDPYYPQALYVLGEILSREKNFDEALQCFRQASKKDARRYLILCIARTLRQMGRYQESLEVLDSVLVKERENLRFLKEKALVFNRMSEWENALKIYEKLQQLDPKDAFVRKEVYRLRGLRRKDAYVISELETVLNVPSRKHDPQLHGLLGQKLKEAGKVEEAAAEFHAAWRLDPDNLYFLRQEGFCHYHLGAYSEAIEALSLVFHKDPNDFRVKTTLRKMFATTNNMEGFAALLEAVLRDHPQNTKLMGTLKAVKKQVYGQALDNA